MTEAIIGAAIEVHRELGPGLFEGLYEQCLCFELANRGLYFERQRIIPARYKGIEFECGFRADLIVERAVIVELKALDVLLPVHKAQVITYLKLLELDVGLLINFNVATLRRGVHRLYKGSSHV